MTLEEEVETQMPSSRDGDTRHRPSRVNVKIHSCVTK